MSEPKYDYEAGTLFSPAGATGPHDILVYEMDVFHDGVLQFRIQLEATPAEVMHNPTLGGFSYEQYPDLAEDYFKIVEARARTILKTWEPIRLVGQRPPQLFRLKWKASAS